MYNGYCVVKIVEFFLALDIIFLSLYCHSVVSIVLVLFIADGVVDRKD